MTLESQTRLNYPILAPETVKTDLLTTFEYAYKSRRSIDILIRQPEFTSVCPMTGLPDFGSITIAYQPREKILELKSLKYYLLQYRNVGTFYEHLVNRILDDLVAVAAPAFMEVTGDFTPRGGLTTSASAVYGEKHV